MARRVTVSSPSPAPTVRTVDPTLAVRRGNRRVMLWPKEEPIPDGWEIEPNQKSNHHHFWSILLREIVH